LEALQRELATAPHSRFVTIPDATHFVFLDRAERGRTQMLREVREFLPTVARPGSRRNNRTERKTQNFLTTSVDGGEPQVSAATGLGPALSLEGEYTQNFELLADDAAAALARSAQHDQGRVGRSGYFPRCAWSRPSAQAWLRKQS
jgi:hypothetical protein